MEGAYPKGPERGRVLEKDPANGNGYRPLVCHLATNHLNMLYMLAAGMVTDPAGFRGKHYADSLVDAEHRKPTTGTG